MSLSGHLKELRNRIIICVIALLIFFLIAFAFSQKIIDFLLAMGKDSGYTYIYTAVPELMLQQLSIGLTASLVVSFPLILYHIWAFIQPGLKRNENALIIAALISGLICFIIGVVFAYKVMLPFMLRFLIGLSKGTSIRANITIGNYISFVLTIFIIFGIVFELPVICVLLTQMGLLKIEWMVKGRKIVIIAAFFIAAIITPPDIVSQIMVALPMLVLYQLSIWLCTLLLKLKGGAGQNSKLLSKIIAIFRKGEK